MFEITIERVACRNIEMRKRIADLRELYVAAFRNFQRAREHIRRILEYLIHLVVVLDIEAGALELHPIRILNALTRLNADHHVLCVSIVFAQVMTVVGCDQRNPKVLLEPEQAWMNPMLHLQALVLNFQIEILLSENVCIR